MYTRNLPLLRLHYLYSEYVDISRKLASWIVAVCERSEYKGVWGAELAHGCQFAAIPCRVAWQIVFFSCYVPGGNSVTFGLDSPLNVRGKDVPKRRRTAGCDFGCG